jgi:hypothetical protein
MRMIHGGTPRTRRASCAAVTAVSVLAVALFASGSGGAAGAKTFTVVGTPGTATLVQTVNVDELPPPGADEFGALPFLTFHPAALAAAKAAGGAASAAPGESESPAAGPTLTPGATLDGAIGAAQSQCGCTPPDMGFAVGNHFKMQQVNLAGRIWDKNNVPGTIFGLKSFYGTSGDFVSDPWVLFDAASQRWFAAIFDVTTSSERLAVSTTKSPNTFKVYNVPEGQTGGCPDQGKLGVSDNVVVIGANEFSSCFSNPQWLGPIFTVLNKAQLVAGNNTIDTAAVGPLIKYSSSMVPAQSMSSTRTQWWAGVDDPTSTVAHIVKTTGTPPNTVKLTEPFTPTIKKLTYPPGAQQKGTGTLLETNDNRTDNVVWQNDSLIFAESTGCVPRNDTQTRACVHITNFNTSAGTVTFDKTRSQAGAYLFFPAVQVDPSGSIALGYGRSSSSLYPELDAVPVDLTGAFGKKKVLVKGTAPNTSGRYGDYFAEAVDPDATSDIWVAGEIGGDGWSTAVRQTTLAP